MFGRRIAILILVLLAAAAAPTAASGQTRRIYLANDDHTDYMWSVDAGQTRDAILRMLDYYLDLADATDGDSSDLQSRFSADGSFWLWTYESNRSAADFDRLIRRVKSGHIAAPLTLLNLGYGAMPAEAVLRSLYYAGSLERRHGLTFKLAMSQENQSLPYGLGALWAGAGARYSWRGICGCASQIPDAWNRPADMYWWQGQDGSRILMKWYSQIRRDYYGIGGYAEARDASSAIAQTEGTDFRSRVPYAVIGLFGYGGDDVDSRTDAVIAAARAASTADRRVIVSNEIDFFEDFEAVHGAEIPSLALSFGNEWELLTASLAELSGRVKRGVERLRGAEALAALVSARDASFMRGREADREKAWISLGLYFEHDWTADGPVSRQARADWEREQASTFLGYVDKLAADAASRLGAMIRKDGGQRRFFVFNPLSWSRTDAADLDLGGESEVHAVDVATGREAASQWVGAEGSRRLRIWAEDVPSLGYKVFEIVAGAGSPGGGPAGPAVKRA
jgi:alpha-mannosidase